MQLLGFYCCCCLLATSHCRTWQEIWPRNPLVHVRLHQDKAVSHQDCLFDFPALLYHSCATGGANRVVWQYKIELDDPLGRQGGAEPPKGRCCPQRTACYTPPIAPSPLVLLRSPSASSPIMCTVELLDCAIDCGRPQPTAAVRSCSTQTTNCRRSHSRPARTKPVLSKPAFVPSVRSASVRPVKTHPVKKIPPNMHVKRGNGGIRNIYGQGASGVEKQNSAAARKPVSQNSRASPAHVLRQTHNKDVRSLPADKSLKYGTETARDHQLPAPPPPPRPSKNISMPPTFLDTCEDNASTISSISKSSNNSIPLSSPASPDCSPMDPSPGVSVTPTPPEIKSTRADTLHCMFPPPAPTGTPEHPTNFSHTMRSRSMPTRRRISAQSQNNPTIHLIHATTQPKIVVRSRSAGSSLSLIHI